MTDAAYTNIDEYIARAPEQTREFLRSIRQTIRKAIPAEAGEKISYGIPTFTLNGTYLIYFAGYKNHVSVYPIPGGLDAALEKEIAPFVAGRGTLRFPLDKPLPLDLIKKIALLHVERNSQKRK